MTPAPHTPYALAARSAAPAPAGRSTCRVAETGLRDGFGVIVARVDVDVVVVICLIGLVLIGLIGQSPGGS